MAYLKVKQIIFEMNKEFSLEDLYNKCNESGITNKKLILDVLDGLLDAGIVNYADLTIGHEKYKTKF